MVQWITKPRQKVHQISARNKCMKKSKIELESVVRLLSIGSNQFIERSVRSDSINRLLTPDFIFESLHWMPGSRKSENPFSKMSNRNRGGGGRGSVRTRGRASCTIELHKRSARWVLVRKYGRNRFCHKPTWSWQSYRRQHQPERRNARPLVRHQFQRMCRRWDRKSVV